MSNKVLTVIGIIAVTAMLAGLWFLSVVESEGTEQRNAQGRADLDRMRAAGLLRELTSPEGFPRPRLDDLEAELGGEVTPLYLISVPGMRAALAERGERIREDLRVTLRDPSSVVWGPLWTKDFRTFCGTVNARNAYGAYTGQTPFYVTAWGIEMRSSARGSRWSDETWNERCVGGEQYFALQADPV